MPRADEFPPLFDVTEEVIPAPPFPTTIELFIPAEAVTVPVLSPPAPPPPARRYPPAPPPATIKYSTVPVLSTIKVEVPTVVNV
jgi:hypothetical protein